MERVKTPEFRVSFPAVFEPRSFNGKEPKYEITMLFDKSTDISELKKLALETVVAKWGKDKAKWPKGLYIPFRDGDKEKADKEGYANTIFVKAASKMKPGLINRNKKGIVDPNEFYAGCYAIATLTCYSYENVKVGVGFGLQNIMKTRDGEAFSGRVSASDDFADTNLGEDIDDTNLDLDNSDGLGL